MYEKLSKRALKNMYMAAGFATVVYLIIALVVELAILYLIILQLDSYTCYSDNFDGDKLYSKSCFQISQIQV